jgi:hypothetical protein
MHPLRGNIIIKLIYFKIGVFMESFSSSKIVSDLHKALMAEHEEREPFEMCSSNLHDAVAPSDYFYSMMELLKNDAAKNKEMLRPKKTEHLKKLADNSEEYNRLAAEKKELFSVLKSELIEKKPEAFKRLLIANARNNIDFDSINLSFLSEDLKKDLTHVYENYRSHYQKQILKENEDLIYFLDLTKPLTERQIEQKARDEKKRAINWDDRTKIFEEINRVWPDIRSELWNFVRNSIYDRDIPRNFRDTISRAIVPDAKAAGPLKKLIYSLTYNLLAEFIWDIIKKNVEIEKDTAIMDSFFKEKDGSIKNCLTSNDDYMLIKTIMKEQKKHSFQRFCGLFDNYVNFISHAKIIQQKANEINEELGAQVISIISDLIRNSHHDIPSKATLALLKTKTDEKSQQNYAELKKTKKILTVLDNHHSHDIMGCEKKGTYTPLDKQNAVNIINATFQLYGTKYEVKGYEHAHTYPFPSLVNWNPKRITKIINQSGLVLSNDFRSPHRFIKADFFKTIRKENDNKLLNDNFADVITVIKEESDGDNAKFIYSAIEFLKKYHLKVFSETELVPDFINKILDQLSEWKIPKAHYKKFIAFSIIDLLKRDVVTKRDVALMFESYRTETNNKMASQIDSWSKSNSIFNIVLNIGAIQIKQALTLGWLDAGICVEDKSD